MSDGRRLRSGTAGTGALLPAAGAVPLIALLLATGAEEARAQAAEDDGRPTTRVQEDAQAEEGEQAEADAEAPDRRPGVDADMFAGGGGTPGEFVHVPVVTIYPGAVPVRPTIENPVADDPAAAQRGMDYFNQMNCIGCHAPNGAGGMGPSLSNSTFLYGKEPENIYLSILQGRPKGMPAWGGMLPDHAIWDLVAYIRAISKEPAAPWGRTTSADGFTIEQVPAEFITTVEPWQYTTPFSYGQAPFEKPKGSPPLETPKESGP